MAYSALDVAKYIIWYSHKKGYPISNLRLQKLLYFVQADFIMKKDSPCFDDGIIAWGFGPVIPDVYHEYKIYGATEIPKSKGRNGYAKIREADMQLIDELLDESSSYSTSQLVDITHKQAPWKDVYKGRYSNEPITQDAIREYFCG